MIINILTFNIIKIWGFILFIIENEYMYMAL